MTARKGASPAFLAASMETARKRARAEYEAIVWKLREEYGWAIRCAGVTSAGEVCRNLTPPGRQYCWQHDDQAPKSDAAGGCLTGGS